MINRRMTKALKLIVYKMINIIYNVKITPNEPVSKLVVISISFATIDL